MTIHIPFVDGDPQDSNRVKAAWLNDINRSVYQAIGDGTNAPATPAQVVTNLGLAASTGASLINTILPDTGAVTQTVEEVLNDTIFISVTRFGAICDDIADDTAAIQTAANCLGDASISGRSGIVLVFPGPCRITDTIVFDRTSIILQGGGWGYRTDTNPRRSWIRWDGAAGKPMFEVRDVTGFGIRDMRFIGNSAAKPSAAIRFKQGAGVAISSNFIDNVFIGWFTGETDSLDQFTDGILFDGLAVNNAEMLITKVKMRGITGVGIRQTSIQNTNHHYSDCMFARCGIAIRVCAEAAITQCNFSICGTDIQIPELDDSGANAAPQVMVHNYQSEQSGRMVEKLGGGVISFIGGAFSASSALIDDKVIKDESAHASQWRIQDFEFFKAGGALAPTGTPYLSFPCGQLAQRNIIIDGVKGWDNLTGGVNGMDVSTASSGSSGPRAYVYFRENRAVGAPSSNLQFLPNRVAQNYLSGTTAEQWDITRFETINNHDLKLHDGFLGRALNADLWGTHVGTDPQCAAAAILLGSAGGMARMVTGDDAAATMAANGTQIWSDLNWLSVGGYVIFEARVKISAITNLCVFVGLTDQVAALEMPIEMAPGDTTVSNASNAVGWVFDTAADTDHWWLVGVRTNTDATPQDSGLAPGIDTYEVLRIETTWNGKAFFYRNGVLIGTEMSNSGTGALTPVVAAFSRGAASRNVDCDYIMVQQNRE